MVWALFAHMALWVAFFCWVLLGLLYWSGRSQVEWLKKFAGRFGQSPADTQQVRQLMGRFGFLFMAIGFFFLLLSIPTAEIAPERQGELALMKAACVLLALWLMKGIRDLVKTQTGPNSRSGK